MMNIFPTIPNDTPCVTTPLSCKIENVFYGRRDIYGRTPQAAAVPGMSDGAGAGAAVPPVLRVGAVRRAAGTGGAYPPLPCVRRGADVDGQHGYRGVECSDAPHPAGVSGGLRPVRRRYRLPDGVPESHGGAGYSGRLLRRLLRRGTGHPDGTEQRDGHGVRVPVQSADSGAGLSYRQPYAGQPRGQHPAGGHHGGVAVFCRHVLHKAGGRPQQPAAPDHLLAWAACPAPG